MLTEKITYRILIWIQLTGKPRLIFKIPGMIIASGNNSFNSVHRQNQLDQISLIDKMEKK